METVKVAILDELPKRPPQVAPKDGEGSLQISVYRTDHRATARLDVPFWIGDLLDVGLLAGTRADMHVALDKLLDRLIGRGLVVTDSAKTD